MDAAAAKTLSFALMIPPSFFGTPSVDRRQGVPQVDGAANDVFGSSCYLSQ
jgi:hypothetical protein